MSTTLFNNTQFGLRSSPVNLADQLPMLAVRLLTDLNATLNVPAFTAPVEGWPGASYIVAQSLLDFGSRWSIQVPVVPPSYSFVAAVAYLDPDTGVWVRRKLWTDVGEVLNYPVYSGEVLPATDVHFEIWTVKNFPEEAVLESEWLLPLTLLELPDSFEDETGTGTDLAALCLTHSEVPTTLEEALSICPL